MLCFFRLSNFKYRCFSITSQMAADPRHPQSKVLGDDVAEGAANVSYGPKVFYNPVQCFNRDLSVTVLNQFVRERVGEEKFKELKTGVKLEGGIKILEPLAATGLRSIRYALEVPGIEEVHSNDLSSEAVNLLKENVKKNNVEDLIKITEDDAISIMFNARPSAMIRRYDVIDIDPFGTPSPFLDSAVQAVADGGLLCVTATDAAILCGKHIETCHAIYGSMGLNAAPFCHEMGVRILLRAIEAHANRYGRSIEPLLSLSIDFYMRVFVRVHTGAKRAKMTVTRLSMVHRCVGCGAFHLQPLGKAINVEKDQFAPSVGNYPPEKCPDCGWRFQIGGPIWSDPIHNSDFLKGMFQLISEEPLSKLATHPRLEGTLALAREELPNNPLYYVIDRLFGTVHGQAPTAVKFRSAILNGGYQVSLAHAAKASIKTDAPPSYIWDVVRAWIKDNPIKNSRKEEKSPGAAILEKEPSHEISFEKHPDAEPLSRQAGLRRWEVPPPFWGPGSKKPSKTKALTEEKDENDGDTNSKKAKCG